MHRGAAAALLGCILAVPAVPAVAGSPPGSLAGSFPGRLCQDAIAEARRAVGIPDQLLDAIGIVESGRRDPATGRVGPWPWTINVGGQGRFFDSKDEAVAAVASLQADGARSIDVGCMQVNLRHHPDAFPSLERAFDPRANVAYAARFLGQLHQQTNDWPLAAANYHSQVPERGAQYQRRVLAAWPLAPRSARRPRTADPGVYTPEFAAARAGDAAAREARLAAMRWPAASRPSSRRTAEAPATRRTPG